MPGADERPGRHNTTNPRDAVVFSNETAVAVLVALGLYVVAEAVSIIRELIACRAQAADAALEVTRRRRTTTRIPAGAR
jgi:hypothetical protein